MQGRKWLILAFSAVIALTSVTPAFAYVPQDDSYSATDPRTWTNRELAAQTIFTCSSSGSLYAQKRNVEAGLGGLALVGIGTTSRIGSQLKAIRKNSPNGVGLVIASDEEGGWVQRLRRAIYTLPSATTMGTWSNAKITRTAFAYGKRMKALGVDIAFSPVADLNVPGFFIDQNRRGFSNSPKLAGEKATAWATGLMQAGVVPTVKHWPGHGNAGDTHAAPSTLNHFDVLKSRDLLPFTYAFEHGVRMAMVGHLLVPGLTELRTPTSRSPKALARLRQELGPNGIIITDSLSMGGATKWLKRNIPEAAIRSLRAGADIALVCTGPRNLISKVTEALDDGKLDRDAMIVKVNRILKLKRALGLVAKTPMHSMSVQWIG